MRNKKANLFEIRIFLRFQFCLANGMYTIVDGTDDFNKCKFSLQFELHVCAKNGRTM